MKIFLDTADTSLIEKHFSTGLIDGVTTNPTLIRQSGRDPEEVYQELSDLGIMDISMEVVGDSETMTSEGLRLAAKFQEVATSPNFSASLRPSEVIVSLSPTTSILISIIPRSASSW